MLWQLLLMGYVVLVTSRPSFSNVEHMLDDVTWGDLAPEYSEWIYAGSPENTGPRRIGGGGRTSKRALTVLTRWKPFSMGFSALVGRYPPRAPLVSMLPGIDFVSAETRGQRPSGQPLRWGRRR